MEESSLQITITGAIVVFMLINLAMFIAAFMLSDATRVDVLSAMQQVMRSTVIKFNKKRVTVVEMCILVPGVLILIYSIFTTFCSTY